MLYHQTVHAHNDFNQKIRFLYRLSYPKDKYFKNKEERITILKTNAVYDDHFRTTHYGDPDPISSPDFQLPEVDSEIEIDKPDKLNDFVEPENNVT